MNVCANCDSDLVLDRSDTGPGGWLGRRHDLSLYHQNSTCCPGTQNEHEPAMETCPYCNGMGQEWDTCEGCGGEIDTDHDSTEDYACGECCDSGETQQECPECEGTGELMVER